MANVNGIGEVDELVNVLDELAEFEEEAQAEREERRVRSGYVSGGKDARAFLRLPGCGQAWRNRRRQCSLPFVGCVPTTHPARDESDPRLLEILRRHASAERPSHGRRLGFRALGSSSSLLEALARTAPGVTHALWRSWPS